MAGKASETRLPVSHETLEKTRDAKYDGGFRTYDEFISTLVDAVDPRELE